MKKKLLRLLSTIILVIVQFNISELKAFQYNSPDFVFIIDVSGSMIGLPSGSGNQRIFPQVKEHIKDYLIKSVEIGSIVHFIPFATDIREAEFKIIEVTSEEKRNETIQYINGLEAWGDQTAIYKALNYAFNNIQRRQNTPTIYYVYTDGKDTASWPITFQAMLDEYHLTKGEYDHIFIRTLGIEFDSDLKKLIDRYPDIDIIEEEEGEITLATRINLEPYTLDFGNIYTSDKVITPNAIQQIVLKSNNISVPPGTMIMFSAEFNTGNSGSVVNILPYTLDISNLQSGQVIDLTLEVINYRNLPEEQFEGKVRISSGGRKIEIIPKVINVSFSNVAPSSVTIKPFLQESFPLKFGTFAHTAGSTARLTKTIALEFNNRAKAQNNQISIMAYSDEIDSREVIRINDRELNQYNSVEISSAIDELTVDVIRKQIKPGAYQGKFVIGSDDVVILGENLEEERDHPGSKVINWEFSINEPPTPAWMLLFYSLIGLLFLLIIGYIIWCLKSGMSLSDGYNRFFPKLDGEIVFKEPSELDKISLQGKKSIVIGKGGDIASHSDGVCRLIPEFKDNQLHIRIKAEEESTLLVNDEIVINDYIYDSDIIEFGTNVVIVFEYLNDKLPKPSLTDITDIKEEQ